MLLTLKTCARSTDDGSARTCSLCKGAECDSRGCEGSLQVCSSFLPRVKRPAMGRQEICHHCRHQRCCLLHKTDSTFLWPSRPLLNCLMIYRASIHTECCYFASCGCLVMAHIVSQSAKCRSRPVMTAHTEARLRKLMRFMRTSWLISGSKSIALSLPAPICMWFTPAKTIWECIQWPRAQRETVGT